MRLLGILTQQEWESQLGTIAFGIVLKEVVKSCGLIAKTVHPVVSTMLPRANRKLENFIQTWCGMISMEVFNSQ